MKARSPNATEILCAREPLVTAGVASYTHTAVFVVLDMELGEEPCRAHSYKRWAFRIRPEEGGEFLERRLVQVVRNYDRETRQPVLSLLRPQQILDVFEYGLALHALVQLAQEGDGLLRAGLPYALSRIEEEVVSCICRCGDGGVEDREVAYAGEDEILEDGGRCG